MAGRREPGREIRAKDRFLQHPARGIEVHVVVAIADPGFNRACGKIQGAFLLELVGCIAGREDFNARSSKKSLLGAKGYDAHVVFPLVGQIDHSTPGAEKRNLELYGLTAVSGRLLEASTLFLWAGFLHRPSSERLLIPCALACSHLVLIPFFPHRRVTTVTDAHRGGIGGFNIGGFLHRRHLAVTDALKFSRTSLRFSFFSHRHHRRWLFNPVCALDTFLALWEAPPARKINIKGQYFQRTSPYFLTRAGCKIASTTRSRHHFRA